MHQSHYVKVIVNHDWRLETLQECFNLISVQTQLPTKQEWLLKTPGDSNVWLLIVLPKLGVFAVLRKHYIILIAISFPWKQQHFIDFT